MKTRSVPLSRLSFLFVSFAELLWYSKTPIFIVSPPARVPNLTLGTAGLNLLALIAITTLSNLPVTSQPPLPALIWDLFLPHWFLSLFPIFLPCWMVNPIDQPTYRVRFAPSPPMVPAYSCHSLNIDAWISDWTREMTWDDLKVHFNHRISSDFPLLFFH